MHLATLPDRRASQDPHGLAVSDGTRTLTNEQLLERVRGSARHLRDLGTRPGEIVALKLTPRVEFVTLVFSTWRLGATVAPIDPDLTELVIAQQLADTQPKLLIVEDEAVVPFDVATLRISKLCQCLGWEDYPPFVDGSDAALFTYKRGPAGAPEAEVVDHDNLLATVRTSRELRHEAPDRPWGADMPRFDVNGIVTSILLPLVAGASIVIAPPPHPNALLDLTGAEQATFATMVGRSRN